MTLAKNPRSPLWKLIVFSFLAFLLLLSVLEGLARLPVLDQISPYRSMGTFDSQFEIKWFRLQDYVQQYGGVDILFVGNSLVNTGIDPDVVAKAYYEQTGIQARMFNFGVEGTTVSPNSVITRLLVERYHPALVIYVTEMRDYIAGNAVDFESRFLADPWIRYQRGDFTIFGWLVDHSAGLQKYLPYRDWMLADFPGTIFGYINRYNTTTLSGYEADYEIGTNIDVLPDPANPQDATYFKAYGNYQIAPSRLAELKDILDFSRGQGTAVWVVEMPVHPTFYTYVGGESVHQQFQQTISTTVQTNGGWFLPATACLDVIPLNGRSNRWHLNFQGAPLFSTCLGQQLAFLGSQQNTTFIKPAAGDGK